MTFSENPYCGRSSASYLIICRRRFNITRFQLVSQGFSSIKPKEILVCSLNRSIGTKNEEESSITTDVLDGDAMIDNGNVVINALWIIFLKRWDLKWFYVKMNFLMIILNDIILTLIHDATQLITMKNMIQSIISVILYLFTSLYKYNDVIPL